MAAYSEYKDSGQQWLGMIPSHWITRRAKFIFDRHRRPVRDEDEIVTCFRDGTVTLRKNRRETGFTNALKEFGYQGIRKGDLVVHQMDAFAGSIGVSDSDGKATPVLSVCTMKDKNSLAWYYAYLLRVMSKTDFIQSFSRGIRERSTAFGYDIMGNLWLPIPPAEEQEAIVAYLDKVTADIDKEIEAKERIIVALEERRKIIITQAVTRGINPDVPLRDSGIDWLGKIPAHWEMKRFKNHAHVKSNLVSPNDYLNYPQISPDCIEKGTGILIGYSNVKDSGVISDNHLFYSGQIIYSKIRPILNKVIIAPFDGLCSADMYPIETEGDTKYLLYLMLSNFFASQISTVVAERVKMPKINKQELGSLLLPMPPIEEQKLIVEYLDKNLNPIENLVDQQKHLIELLRERKNIIINETVTGHRVPESAVRACSGTAERSHDCTK